MNNEYNVNLNLLFNVIDTKLKNKVRQIRSVLAMVWKQRQPALLALLRTNRKSPAQISKRS